MEMNFIILVLVKQLKKLLTDYKVILTLSDKDVPASIQKSLADENAEISADDATKLVGTINALSKQF